MMRLRDRNVLEHILQYCNEIKNTIQRFGENEEIFRQDIDYQKSIALSVLQIGELAGNFTEEFLAEYRDKPWHEMKAMRNVVAHRYGSLDIITLWETATQDIPDLLAYCEKLTTMVEAKLQNISYDEKMVSQHSCSEPEQFSPKL